ncbi:HlyD family secretion protein [Lachnospiraceae bacterium C1.1]|nr:efflux RND transporter periplasmic adaptor subunit [Lachnospiraceae bacterium C1.1]
MKLKADETKMYTPDSGVPKSSNPVGRFFKKQWKKLLALVLVAAIGLGAFTWYKNKKAKEAMEAARSSQTFETVTKMDISNSIAVTGTIESAESRTVTTLVSDTKVLSVSVNVGDYVNAGDVICTFDTSSIEDKIERLQKKMKVAEAQDAIEEAEAARKLARAEADYWTDVSENQINVDAAVRDYEAQERDIADASTDLEEAKQDYEDAQDDYSSYKKKVKKLKNLIEDYYESGDSALSGSGYSSIDDVESDYESYKDKRDDAEDNVTTYERKIEDLESSLTDTTAAIYDSQDTYDKAVNSLNDTMTTDYRAIEDAQSNLESVQLGNQTTNDDNQQTLEDYQEQLEDCVVVAPIYGVITSLSVEEGDEYTSSASSSQEVCVIQDDTSYKVSGDVDEYDISSISVNQTAVIKTDATGDDELTGVVTKVYPVPDSDSSDTAYEVEIDLDERDSRIRIGMTAETSILTESRTGVLAVPYNCVEEDEDGNTYVYVVADGASGAGSASGNKASASGNAPAEAGTDSKKPSGKSESADTGIQTKKVAVETGLETDYYTEIISDDIKEGDKVLVPDSSSSSSSSDSSDSEMNMGMMGGGAPGGGGGGAPGGGGGGGPH